MYERREIFPYAPLALVAAELRFPYSPRLGQQSALDALALSLEQYLPVVRPRRETSLTLPGGKSRTETIYGLFNADSTTSLSIASSSITLETTKYNEFGDFISILLAACREIESRKFVAALERIGLRYIDEIRVPSRIEDARDWRSWISDPLIDILSVAADEPATTCQSVVEYNLGDNRRLAFRFAALNGDPIVGTNPLQRDPFPEPGPYFVIDVDAYWQSSRTDLVTFTAAHAETHLNKLHGPTGRAFQRAITDRSRELFRGKNDA